MEGRMNTEYKGQTFSTLFHTQGMPNDEEDGQQLAVQSESSTNTLQQCRFSTSPSSTMLGTEAVRKKSWGRNVSIRTSNSSSLQQYNQENQDAADIAPKIQRAATWGREQRATMDENCSPDCPSACSEPNDGKTSLRAQVHSICEAGIFVDIIEMYLKMHGPF